MYKEFGIELRMYKPTMLFKKKLNCLQRKGGTCSQARQAFLGIWTGKKGNCFNHLLQRTVIKALTGLDLQSG